MPTYVVTLDDRIAPGVLADSPTHYWKLSEGGGTVANDSAAAADGVIAGSPAKGMRFDGTNDVITIAGVTASTTTFTIECWLTPDSTQGDALGAILAVNSGNGLFYDSASGKLNFRHSAADHLSTTALTDGVRVHVVFSVAAGAGTFYVDGVADGTVAAVPAITPDRIGSLAASTSNLKGVLSHVAYYVGAALSAGQAAAHAALPVVTVKMGSLTGSDTAKGDDVLTFSVPSSDGGYRPAVGAECRMTIDGDLVFGGEVSRVYESGWRGLGVVPIYSRVTATSFKQLANRIVFTETLVAGSLESMATTIAAALGELGVIIDPAQATGPSLEEVSEPNAPANEVLDLLQEMTGGAWVWEIDASRVLRFFEAAANTCPFDVTTANRNAIGDVTVERRRENWYANRVTVNGGEGYWQNILGETHFGDGAKTTFEMNAPMFYYENDYTATLGYMVGLSITVVRSGGTTIEHANDQLDAQWTFNRGPEYSLTQVSGAVLGGTEYILIGSHAESGYSASFPMILVADDTAAQEADGIREVVIDRPDLFDRAAIQAFADSELARRSGGITEVTYETAQLGAKPGQTQTITIAERGLDDTFTITQVNTANNVGNSVRRIITAVQGTNVMVDWRQGYRDWLGGGDKTSATTPGTLPAGPYIPTNPAGSTTWVQYNDGGVFGAEAAFTYTKGTNTLVADTHKSNVETALALASGDGASSHAGNVSITGGAANANGSNSGSITMAGGSPTGGTSTNAGSITIKSGDIRTNPGAVTITTGSIPAAPAALGTMISVVVATPAAGSSITGVTGGAISVAAGPGQADGSTALGNGTGGDGGPLTLVAGVGGAETVAGNTRQGGHGGTVTVQAGDGGNAPAAGGTTNTGGNGGNVVLDPGTGGTGSTANGVAGGVLIPAAFLQMTEMTAPAAGATNAVRIYAEDNGAGKTRLMALFATGAAQQIAIEP